LSRLQLSCPREVEILLGCRSTNIWADPVDGGENTDRPCPGNRGLLCNKPVYKPANDRTLVIEFLLALDETLPVSLVFCTENAVCLGLLGAPSENGDAKAGVLHDHTGGVEAAAWGVVNVCGVQINGSHVRVLVSSTEVEMIRMSISSAA
jgi:hypothetical protein